MDELGLVTRSHCTASVVAFVYKMDIPSIDSVPVKNIPSDPRITNISGLFEENFGHKPCYIVRVPGRVNIIGEHIDYCGYPVLPMALEQDILMAVGKINEPELKIRNINSKYPNYYTKIENIQIIPDIDGRPYWYNYVLCGIKGALEYMNDKFSTGLELMVDGNIPPASGLSSSSALVSASCLSHLYAHGIVMDKSKIATLCASCERYIGTQGGGMDQAIAFLGDKYCAQYITWNPLKATPVNLPEEAAFVVAHSLAEANKAATNDFNRRVIECRLSAKIIAYISGVSSDSKIITLSQVQERLGKNLEEMVGLVLKHLPQMSYTREEICHILEITDEQLSDLYLTQNTVHLREFKLQQRAIHVYEEAIRVEKFRQACIQYSTTNNKASNGINGIKMNGDAVYDDILETLGNLMTESHYSLKKLYECSHDNLDKLVEISKDMNVHCRLTGAGWGGCVVALCPRYKVDNYIEKLQKCFYKEHCDIDFNTSKRYVFSTAPNYGAVIYSNIIK